MIQKKKNEKSKYVMLFMIDGSIKKVAPDKLPDYRLIQYIFIPLEGFLSTSYICVKSNPYINFDKAVIKNDISIEFYSDGVIGNTIEMRDNVIEVNNICDLYNYLHSILRYERSNIFVGSYISEDLPSDIYIEFSLFEIELYLNDEMIYYKKQVKRDNRTFSANDILETLITDLYPPMYKEFKMNKSATELFVISNNKWKIKKKTKIHHTDLVGIFGPYMKTVSFLDMESFNIVCRNVKGFSLSMYIVDDALYPELSEYSSSELHDVIEVQIPPIKSCYMWVNDPATTIEIFDMIQIYSSLFKTIIGEYYRLNYPDKYNTMKMKAYWIFCMDFNSIRHSSEILSVSDDKPTTIADFINGIRNTERQLI